MVRGLENTNVQVSWSGVKEEKSHSQGAKLKVLSAPEVVNYNTI